MYLVLCRAALCVCLCSRVYSRVGASCVGRPTCVCAVWAPLRRVNRYWASTRVEAQVHISVRRAGIIGATRAGDIHVHVCLESGIGGARAFGRSSTCPVETMRSRTLPEHMHTPLDSTRALREHDRVHPRGHTHTFTQVTPHSIVIQSQKSPKGEGANPFG